MSISKDIDILNAKVAQLKVEYEQYFMRVIKREPLKLREEVDKIIRQYSTTHISNTSLKFKYNSVVAKYNSYKQYWTRVLRAIEEGTYVRRAESFTSRKATTQDPPQTAKNTQPARPDKDERVDQDLKDIYKQYLEARAQCNEPTKGITYESFAKTVETTTKKASDVYKTNDVELKVYVKDGKTKLAIKPKKG